MSGPVYLPDPEPDPGFVADALADLQLAWSTQRAAMLGEIRDMEDQLTAMQAHLRELAAQNERLMRPAVEVDFPEGMKAIRGD